MRLLGAHALLWCCVLSVLISLRVSLQLDDTRVRAPRVCVHAPRTRRARATVTAAADGALPFFSSSFSVALVPRIWSMARWGLWNKARLVIFFDLAMG